jgi:cob(I)alamin adenosyltransferase
MKIYTKTGDKGTTALIGGVRVPKNHLRIECYGTVDELNSYIGVVRDAANDADANAWLQEIQDRLFTIGAELATAPNKDVKMAIPDLHAEDITWLEGLMDQMNETLPEMRSFILPGGNLAASHCHVARCVCRRAERLAVALEAEEANVPELVIPYLNRLSDFLFTLCRHLTHQANGVETPWRARM